MSSYNRISLAAILVACAACSMGIRGPRRPYPPAGQPLDCTMDSNAPGADVGAGVVLGTLAFGIGMGAATFDGCILGPCEANNPVTGGELAGILLATTVVSLPFFLSASAGSARMDECRRANRERDELIAGRPDLESVGSSPHNP